MILSDKTILEELEHSVFIKPFTRSQLNPNSYDVCLGNWFYRVKWDWGFDSKTYKPTFGTPIYVEDGDFIQILQGETILGMTKEIIGGTIDICTQLHSKSSTRRCGITVCDDAGYGDIGYVNHWTVELTAHTAGAWLEVGIPFAQISFIKCTSVPTKPYSGQYNSEEWPECMIPRRYRIGKK